MTYHVLKVRCIDAYMPKNCATEDHWNNEQVAEAVKIKVA